jgi:O-antigen ligase/tetratricopeptide (TPR) repeat protein
MAKRKKSSPPRGPQGLRPDTAAAALEPAFVTGPLPAAAESRSTAARVAAAPIEMPQESAKGDWAPWLLCAMMVIAPAVGATTEEMLQDTLKSIVVSFAALGALLLFFMKSQRRGALRWHAFLWIPIAWMAYAAIAAVAGTFNGKSWGHPYLSTVEMIRWFIFIIIVWLTLNTMTRQRFGHLALAIHLGGVMAAFWGLCQFFFDMRLFPQGPAPASTFVNRNFLSEFVACTIPFALYCLATARRWSTALPLTVTTAITVAILGITGTRSAIASVLFSCIFLGIWVVTSRKQLAWTDWGWRKQASVAALFVTVVVSLWSAPAGTPLVDWKNGFDRFSQRGSTFGAAEYTVGSTSLRFRMWRNSVTMIKAVPVFGVGPGAWEAMQPLYQDQGVQIETDYYAHNEVLQLFAEYGLLGWVSLLALLGIMARSQWLAWRIKHPNREEELAIRWVALAGFTAFMCGSQFGFPWRLASTCAMFALILGVLAASDARLGISGPLAATALRWRSAWSTAGILFTVGCTLLAAFISERAAQCEFLIVRATKMALGLTASGDPNNPRFERTKAEIRDMIKRGTDINPHYRKITPMVADEFAKWGDWASATPIWMSVLSSRPYIPAIISNAARGYSTLGQAEKAFELLDKAKKISPDGASIRSLEIVLLARAGRMDEAAKRAQQAFTDGRADFDAAQAAIVVGRTQQDWALVRQALEWRTQGATQLNADTFMQQAELAWNLDKDLEGAVKLYRKAMQAATPQQRQTFAQFVPEPVRARVMDGF